MPSATIRSRKRRSSNAGRNKPSYAGVDIDNCFLTRLAVGFRLSQICGLALVMTIGGARARDIEMGGDNQYPNSIMAPEPGTSSHHHPATLARSRHPSLLGREKFVAKLHRGPRTFATRGSSGSVLPTPLPRTMLIPPEGGGRLTEPAIPQQQGPSVVPGVASPVPNLPHGAETFQDRAARCSFQSGLYGVPGGARTQYMGSCVQ